MVGVVAYKLELPQTCSIHLVIYVSLLRKALAPNETAQQELLASEEDRVADKVLGHRVHRSGATLGTQVLV